MGTAAAIGMKIVGSALEIEGHRMAGESARVTGQRRNVAKQLEAQQLDQEAKLEVAAAQRDMLEKRRQANLLASRALALAGASGAGAGDKTVVDIIASIAAEGSHQASLKLYRGEERARKLRLAGKVARYEGALAEEAGLRGEAAHQIAGHAALFGGASSLAARYNRDDDPGGNSGGGWLDAGSVSGSYG